MRQLPLLLIIMAVLFSPSLTAQWRIGSWWQVNPAYSASIDTPTAGQVVQGSVVIRGKMDIAGFQSFEVDFTYKDDPTHTWFMVLESTTPIPEGVLGVWDTSTITDGEYTLRLLVTMTDGAQVEKLVEGLRVRNYSAIETDTPTPTPIYVTLAPSLPAASSSSGQTSTPTQTSYPITPTPLPTNPAVVTSTHIALSLGRGAAVSTGLLAILGAYLGIRSILHKNR